MTNCILHSFLHHFDRNQELVWVFNRCLEIGQRSTTSNREPSLAMIPDSTSFLYRQSSVVYCMNWTKFNCEPGERWALTTSLHLWTVNCPINHAIASIVLYCIQNTQQKVSNFTDSIVFVSHPFLLRSFRQPCRVVIKHEKMILYMIHIRHLRITT